MFGRAPVQRKELPVDVRTPLDDTDKKKSLPIIRADLADVVPVSSRLDVPEREDGDLAAEVDGVGAREHVEPVPAGLLEHLEASRHDGLDASTLGNRLDGTDTTGFGTHLFVVPRVWKGVAK